MEALPIDPHLPAIVRDVRERQGLVLVAEPGAGKTTRVPRALLDAGLAKDGEIVVVEPRRIAARMAAARVADAEHGWFECYEIQRRVDPGITPEAAVLLCTWREVYGGLGDFQLQLGNDLLIFGAGPVGLSFVKFGRLLGMGFIGVVDPVPHKRQRAAAMGSSPTAVNTE